MKGHEFRGDGGAKGDVEGGEVGGEGAGGRNDGGLLWPLWSPPSSCPFPPLRIAVPFPPTRENLQLNPHLPPSSSLTFDFLPSPTTTSSVPSPTSPSSLIFGPSTSPSTSSPIESPHSFPPSLLNILLSHNYLSGSILSPSLAPSPVFLTFKPSTSPSTSYLIESVDHFLLISSTSSSLTTTSPTTLTPLSLAPSPTSTSTRTTSSAPSTHPSINLLPLPQIQLPLQWNRLSYLESLQFELSQAAQISSQGESLWLCLYSST